DTAGNTATTSIVVNAVTTVPYITLTANIESGIIPLIINFSVSTEIPNSVSIYNMDFEGDGNIDYTGSTFDNINHAYVTEGIYYPTVVVTDSQGIQYSDTIAIVVLNKNDLDALLKAKWNAMKTALANQDVNTALNYFTEETKQHYNELFTALQPSLPQIVQDMQGIELISLKNNSAKYRIRRDDLYGGQTETFTYYIYFMVDDNGIWKIDWY
ncbi:MAG: PKD domain-containing protein, partial [Nitrospinota bacterium]